MQISNRRPRPLIAVMAAAMALMTVIAPVGAAGSAKPVDMTITAYFDRDPFSGPFVAASDLICPSGTAEDDPDSFVGGGFPSGQVIQIQLTKVLTCDDGSGTILVASTDGSDIQPLPIGAGTDYASRMTWSPDGTRIAFERWDGDEERLTIGVLTLATGSVIDVGPQLGAEGVVFDWSPDGTTIIAVPGDDPQLIAIDPSEGSWEPMGSDLSFEQGVLNDFRPSWQRLKP